MIAGGVVYPMRAGPGKIPSRDMSGQAAPRFNAGVLAELGPAISRQKAAAWGRWFVRRTNDHHKLALAVLHPLFKGARNHYEQNGNLLKRLDPIA
jgi:hypothetical protein